MPSNVEIKTRANDFESMRNRAEELSDTPQRIIDQEDTFFSIPKGRLKLRKFSPDAGELIYYERPDVEGPKQSVYEIAPTNKPDALKSTLASALGVRGVVRKTRRLFMVGQTRIHLDNVDGLGQFVELEVVLKANQSAKDGETIARDLMKQLGISNADLIDGAYIDLMEEQKGKTP